MSLIKNTKGVYKEYCLIGVSKFNYHIGKTLVNEGQKVTVIDVDNSKIDSVGSEFNLAVVADATNIKQLEDIGVQFFDYVIVGVASIETSITICSNLKELGVKNIMAKSKNNVHQRILKSMGVVLNFIPEIEIAEKMAYLTMYDLNVDLFSFGSEVKDAFIVKLMVYNQELIGKPLKDLHFLRELNATVVCIKRFNGEIIVPVTGGHILKKSDNVSLICNKGSIQELKNYFLKNTAPSK